MNDEFNNNDLNRDLDNDVDVNSENENLYNDLMEESRRKNDDYWDRNNPVIKLLLTILLVVGVIGFIYYLIVGLSMK